MNGLKKVLGIVWIALGPVLVFMMASQMMEKLTKADGAIAKAATAAAKATAEVAKLNTTLQWSIILIIFIPCAIGLMIFGYYAVKGEYTIEPAA